MCDLSSNVDQSGNISRKSLNGRALNSTAREKQRVRTPIHRRETAVRLRNDRQRLLISERGAANSEVRRCKATRDRAFAELVYRRIYARTGGNARAWAVIVASITRLQFMVGTLYLVYCQDSSTAVARSSLAQRSVSICRLLVCVGGWWTLVVDVVVVVVVVPHHTF